MKRIPEQIIRDEAEIIAALDRIREGRTVSVSYLQKPWFNVCTVTGAWVPRDPPTRVGWMVLGRGETLATIMPTDQIVLHHLGRLGRLIHLTVLLDGKRMPVNAATVRRARLVGAGKQEGGAE